MKAYTHDMCVFTFNSAYETSWHRRDGLRDWSAAIDRTEL